MITRYFSPSPRVMGPLEFLAGFGQQRQRVHAAEAGMDMQQGQALSQGIAGAGQGIAQGISQGALAQFQAGQQTQQQAARATMLQALQQQRTQGRVYETAVDAYMQAGGAPGQPPPGMQMGPSAPSAGGPPPAAPQAVAQPLGAMMGPPGPGQSQTSPIELPPPMVAAEPAGVPLPAIEPAAIPEYREAVRKRDLLTNYKATIETDPYMPPDEKARKIAALAPHLAATQALIKKNPRPKPPRTHEEIVAAGPHGGGAALIPGTYNAWIAGKEGPKISTAAHPMEDTGWMAEPDPVKRSEAKRTHLENHLQERDGDEYLWDGKEWNKQREERDDFDLADFVGKRAGKTNEQGKMPTVDELIQDGLKVQSAMELARLQQAVQETPNADAILKLVQDRAHISPASYERMVALLQTADTRPLTPGELQERAVLANEWLDALGALKATGVQIPEHMKADLLKHHERFDRYVEAWQPPGGRW